MDGQKYLSRYHLRENKQEEQTKTLIISSHLK